MTFRERALYHQIHPLKLATDWGTGVLAAVWLWQHRLAPALLVGVVPSVLVSALLVRAADLRRERDSAFGRYVARHMTRPVEAGRLAGCAVFWFGSWVHSAGLIAAGLASIVACWVGGLARPAGTPPRGAA